MLSIIIPLLLLIYSSFIILKMKGKQWLCFFINCVCLLQKCKSQVEKVYVCPIENEVIDNLVQYRYQFLCNNAASTSCSLNQEFLTDSYSVYVILLHNRNWSLIKKVTHQLSLCNVNYILLDVKSPMNTNMLSFCSTSTITLIFSLTTDVYSMQITFSTEDCVTKTFTETTNLQSYISSSCPNTIWISGNVDCNNLTTYGEKLFVFNNETDIVRDKTLGKSYLRGKHLRIGMIIDFPYYFETSPGVHSGILVNLIEKISSNLQFSYTIHYPEDNRWGGQNEDGSWNGVVADLINNKTDAAFADLTVTYLRSQVIDFTLPYYFESIGILIRQPELESKVWRMLSLFSPVVWALILVSIIISSLVLYGLHIFAPIPIDSPFNKLGECFWCAICFVAGQGTEYDPGSWSIQNFLSLFCLFVFIVLSTYNGGLIALLTSNQMALPFKDLEGLSLAVKEGRFKVCVPDGTAFFTAVMSGDGFYGPIKDWLLKHQSPNVDLDACTEMLKNYTDIACLDEISRLENVQKNLCQKFNLIILNDKFFPGYFSIGLPKNSVLNGIFSEEIINAVDGGLIMGWKKNYTAASFSFCKILQPDEPVEAGSNVLALPEFIGPFVLMGIGIALSLFGFVFEMRRYFKN